MCIHQFRSCKYTCSRFLHNYHFSRIFCPLQQILAERCLQAGILEVYCNIEATPEGKVDKLLKEVEKGGVALTESKRYTKFYSYDTYRDVKPWEIHLD